MLNCRVKKIKYMLNDKPNMVSSKTLSKDEMMFLVMLNSLGIIKHLSFEKYYLIELEWSNKI